MPTGIIIIDKPQNWTSMDVCGKLRRLYGERRVGHAGTLDPMATGVLPVFVGRATRAVEFAEHGEKEYLAGLRLGISTDTQDTTGEVLAEQPVACSRSEIEDVLGRFRGDIEQIPPMYSALKVNGQKLYQLARKGKTVERKPRPITIYELELGEQIGENEYALRVKCSKGTYIRTLCQDIGDALGCGGCMSSLRRTMAAGKTGRRRLCCCPWISISAPIPPSPLGERPSAAAGTGTTSAPKERMGFTGSTTPRALSSCWESGQAA